MLTSKRTLAERVTRAGDIVAILYGPDGEARLYAHDESRGYSTNYARKRFFYLVGSRGEAVHWIHGVTRDARRKTMEQHWADAGIGVRILLPDLFAAWKR